MKEKTYLIALVCDLSNINMEKKQNKFTDFLFFIRCYGKQKRLKIIEKKWDIGKPYTVTSEWQNYTSSRGHWWFKPSF